MRQYLTEKIRNLALVGHGSSGKTSLAEAMLFRAGVADRLGKIESGNTICDFDPEEIKRGVSVSSAVAPLEWDGRKINLIDTPGSFDFATGLYEGVKASESALIVLSGKSGVTVGAEIAYKLAHDQNKSTMFFVSKLDEENADFYKVLSQLKETFGPHVCPISLPFLEDGKISCYIDLINHCAYRYSEKGERTTAQMPDAGAIVEEYQNAISEAVAETNEELMEKYFAGEKFTKEEMIEGINAGIRAGTFTPVLGGSALSGAGITMLLDAIVAHMPDPTEQEGEPATDAEKNEIVIKYDQGGPLAAYVFKTVADPFVGKLSFVKVISGKLSADVVPVNSRTGEPERLGKIVYVTGKKQEDAQSVVAGDIAAVTKLAQTVTGDTLCDPQKVVSVVPTKFPLATLTMALVAKNKGDEGKIAQGIARLIEEDPVVTFVQDAETRQQLLSGLGEQHLDSVVSKLKTKFGVEVSLKKPRVAYRETIRKKVKVQGRHKKQSGGHGQFGDVWIEFEPCESDELVFEENVFGGAVPKNFFPAVEKGLQDCVKRGLLAGYPMVGLKATLTDGSYHPVDSSEMAFKLAAGVAYKAGIPLAGPAILEPIGNLKVYVPDSYTGDIIGDLNKRRGRIIGMNPTDDGLSEIEGEAPISEMYDFTTTLRSMTQGRGSFVLRFERYELLPSNLEDAVIAQAKELSEE